MVLITINGNSLDTSASVSTRQALGAAANDASNSNYILIHSTQPLKKADKAALAQNNAEIKEYVSENTYLCRYEPQDLAPLRNLDFIDYVDVYPVTFVVNPSLRTHTTGPPGHISSKPRIVDVVLHRGCEFGGCKKAICDAAHVDPEDVTGCKGKVRLTVQERYLDALAGLDDVASIREVHANRLFNNVARGILNAESVNVNGTTLDGAGQIVAVGDTGVDSQHKSFAGTGRIKKLIALGRSGKTNDPDGHGTHVCGSVLGSDTLSSGEKIQGSAPAATLVMQSLLDSRGGLGGIPDDLEELFGPAYAEGARTHNNSWGSVTPGLAYDQQAQEIDEFVEKNPDMVILFAAGNDGVDRDANGSIDLRQIGSQAAAKNCITIGASENNRPDLTVAYGVTDGSGRDPRFGIEPIFGDQYSDDPEGMAAFSSRGPSKEKRVKPDLVAPGTCILSARSSIVQDGEFYGKSPDPRFMFESGTSMACPLASGCAALIRQFLVANPPQSPSQSGAEAQKPIQAPSDYSPTAALVKAVLINGAVELQGQYNPTEAGPSPNPNSGWGRISVKDSALVSSETAGYGEHEGLDEDDTFEVAINVGETGKTLKVTLVWTDPAGVMLQNDLDLTVTSGSAERHGNMGTSKSFDRVNNVEQVSWKDVPQGEVKVKIGVHRLTTDKQSFAYAWKLV
jgi:serine protease AprX